MPGESRSWDAPPPAGAAVAGSLGFFTCTAGQKRKSRREKGEMESGEEIMARVWRIRRGFWDWSNENIYMLRVRNNEGISHLSRIIL